jgi:hypothetical protein
MLCFCTSDNLPQIYTRMTCNTNRQQNKELFSAHLFANRFYSNRCTDVRNIKRSNWTKDSFPITSHELMFIYFCVKLGVTLMEEHRLQVSENKAVRWCWSGFPILNNALTRQLCNSQDRLVLLLGCWSWHKEFRLVVWGCQCLNYTASSGRTIKWLVN